MSNTVVQRVQKRVDSALGRNAAQRPTAIPAGQLTRSSLRDRTGPKTVAYVASLALAVVLARTGFDATGIAEVIGVSALFAHQVGN